MTEIVCICCGVDLLEIERSALSHERSMCAACLREVESLKLVTRLEETLPVQLRIP
jgi:hypothetical protein